MGFVIDGDDIPVQQATIYARLRDPYWCHTYNNGGELALRWYITIIGTDTAPDAESGSDPELHCYLLPFTDRDWRVLTRLQLQWNPESHSASDMSSELRIWDYYSIHTGSIALRDWQNDLIGIDFVGHTASHSFSFQGRLQFTGVDVSGNEDDDDQTMSHRLSKFLDTDLLEPEPIDVHDYSYESGVRMASKHFLPRPQAT